MVWWLAAAAGVFYLLFTKTAPKASEVFKPKPEEGEGTDGVDVPVVRNGGQRRRAGTQAETLEDFTGKEYNPANNPFRKPPAAPPEPETDREGLELEPATDHGGSYDDVADDIEVSVDDIDQDPDMDGDGSDGQI